MKTAKFRAVALAVGLVAVCRAAPSPGFARIVSELDEGGDYLEVVNAATFQSDVEAALDFIWKFAEEAGVADGWDAADVRAVRKVVASSGLLAFRGRGASVRPEGDGSFVHRSFILTERRPVPVLDLFACAPRPANVEGFLPEETAAALSFSADVKGTALFVADTLKALGVPQAEAVRAFCEPVGGQPSLADGFAPGTLVALTLDARRTWQIPDSTLRAPAPGALVVQAVRSGLPWSLLKAAVAPFAQENGVACSETPSPAFPDVERLVLPIPDGRKWNVSPVLAYDRANGVVLAATSAELLDAALAAGLKGKGRLLASAAFRAPAPKSLSGLVYLAPQTLPVLLDLMRQVVPEAEGRSVPPSVARLIADPPEIWYAGTFSRVPDGLKAEARASVGACTTMRMIMGDQLASMWVGTAGMLVGAVFPAVSSAMLTARTSAMAMKGRNLFVGLTKANTERQVVGLAPIWPQTEAPADADGEDISGRTFRNGCDYFNELFDMAQLGEKDWKPYVGGVDLSAVASELRPGRPFQAGDLDWSVAANVTEEMSDVVPVLVSANFNPALLLAEWDGRTDANRRLPIGPASGAAKSLFGDKAVVVVRKSGAAQVIDAKYLTYATLYNRQPFVATGQKAPLVYLTPTGVAVPKGAREADARRR